MARRGAIAAEQLPLATSGVGLGAAAERQAHVQASLLVVTCRPTALAPVGDMAVASDVSLVATHEADFLENTVAGLVHPAAEQTRLVLSLLCAVHRHVPHVATVETLFAGVRLHELAAFHAPTFFLDVCD